MAGYSPTTFELVAPTKEALPQLIGAQPALTLKAHVEANAIIAAGIYLDTFGGRKMEWENALYSHVKTRMDNGNDFIVCSEHKTAKTYGDLAKYVSPMNKKKWEALVAEAHMETEKDALGDAHMETDIMVPWATHTWRILSD